MLYVYASQVNLCRHFCILVKADLGTEYIDNLLISFPPETQEESKQEVWTRVEECVTSSDVLLAGVCDMDITELQSFHSWAKVSDLTVTRP